MKIRPKNIPTFQNGGVPQWYLDRYGNRTSLLGWNLDKRYNYSNDNLNTNDHRNAGNLDTVYRKNIAYTGTPGAISSDILSFYNSNGKGMSAEDFVNFYNSNAAKIRSHWALNLTYNANTAGEHNRLFKKMFASRSNLSQSPGSDYNIGYQDDIENTEGSSTWLRRMDLYENEFDINNPDSNRLHELTLSNGTKALVYKKANGDIGLYNPSTPLLNNLNPIVENQNNESSSTSIITGHKEGGYGFDWSKLREGLGKVLSSPNLYATGRLAGNLINNEKIYGEALKGIKPDLRQTYNTHRQVVGDEATKLAFYKRAAQGETKAARPFTSDADRLMAYMFEAKRVGDELRERGDLADNQEIRRTSDESNQHQWANTLRATEVANANIASMNLANALKHNLLALKHAALWSSIDNFLKEIEYRKREQLAEDLALEDLIWALDLENFLYTPEYAAACKKYNDVLEKHKKSDGTYDLFHPEVVTARGEFLNLLRLYKKKLLLDLLEYKRKKNNYLLTAKSGTKVTKKKKDDLLYKSTRDVVEHFRKMSKMSSDSYNRRTPKIEKLAPHPSGKTRKYQQGGLAPFTVYTPVSLGGETTRTTTTDTSSSRESSSKKGKDEVLDMIKELFKGLVGNGLTSDVNSLYLSMQNFLSRKLAFGEEIDTDDIASMYLLQMYKLNDIRNLKSHYDKAEQAMIQNDAVNEVAVDFRGKLIGIKDDKLLYADSVADAKEKGINILTNGLLLELRANLPQFARRTDLDLIAANGIGMTKIAAFLKAQLPNIGSSESTIEGYTKKDSLNIKAGLLQLTDAPDGYYEYTQHTKDLNLLVKMAINYLKGILPDNMKAVLKAKSEMGGVSEDMLIGSLVGSNIDIVNDFKLTAVTGKAAKDADGKSKSGSGTDTPASVLFLLGNGYSLMVEFNIGNSQSVKALGRFGVLQDVNKHNLGQGSNLLDVSKSLFGPILDLDKATFGGTRLNSAGYTHVLLNNSDCVGMDLPVKKDISGNYVPDFLLLSNIEKAEELIRNNNIADPQRINKIYRDLGLPDKFDLNGNIITLNYKRFAGIQVILDSKALKGGVPINANEVSEADDTERELFIETMQKSGNEKYDLSDGILWSSWGRDKLYKGTIFIPVREDINHGYISGGSPLDTDLPNDANKVTMMLYAPKVQLYLKTPPLSALK